MSWYFLLRPIWLLQTGIRCEKRHTFTTMVGSYNALNTHPDSSRGSSTHTKKQTRAKEVVARYKPLGRLKKISSLYARSSVTPLKPPIKLQVSLSWLLE